MADVDQGSMTSATLNALLNRAMAETHPGIDVRGLDKVGLLSAVMEKEGWASVVALGGIFRGLARHPVIRAVAASPDPAQVLRRWMRIERFGHSRNRTELLSVDADGGEIEIRLRHVTIDGGPIAEVNDLFIWGLLIALIEIAGASGIRALLIQDGQEPFTLHGPGAAAGSSPLPDSTNTLLLRARAFGGPCPAGAAPPGSDVDSSRTALAGLIEQDPVKNWTVSAAAHVLGMSARSFQRSLRNESTTFSEVVLLARVRYAHRLLVDSSLSLTEIAFCAGFADQAHFTRAYRRFGDIPPSALRDIASPSFGVSPSGSIRTKKGMAAGLSGLQASMRKG